MTIVSRSVMAVPCPYCDAEAGAFCRAPASGRQSIAPHSARTAVSLAHDAKHRAERRRAILPADPVREAAHDVIDAMRASSRTMPTDMIEPLMALAEALEAR